MRFASVIALMIAFGVSAAQDLVLTVLPPGNPIHVGDYPRFTITITNRGTNSATLVSPGDGSESKRRTPFIAWSVLPAEAKERKHPEAPSPQPIDCAFMNPVKTSEVFSLKAGEATNLTDWVFCPLPEKPGRFRLVFYYQNEPDLSLRSPSPQDEKGALERIKTSTPCRLVSNEIVVDVLPRRR